MDDGGWVLLDRDSLRMAPPRRHEVRTAYRELRSAGIARKDARRLVVELVYAGHDAGIGTALASLGPPRSCSIHGGRFRGPCPACADL